MNFMVKYECEFFFVKNKLHADIAIMSVETAISLDPWSILLEKNVEKYKINPVFA